MISYIRSLLGVYEPVISNTGEIGINLEYLTCAIILVIAVLYIFKLFMIVAHWVYK